MKVGWNVTVVAWAPLVTFWTAIIAGTLATLPIYKMLLALKSRQTVSQYAPEGHQKKQGTPTMGGLIILLGSVLGIVGADVFMRMGGSFMRTDTPTLWKPWFPCLLILAIGFGAIGFVDDFVVPRLMVGKRGLGWKPKILMQVVVASLAAWVLLGLANVGQAAFFVFLVLFCSNAYNFLDGLDALAGSVLIVLCGGLLVLGTFSVHGEVAEIPLMALIGATIPFLFMNAPPAKVFMGDVGSLPIGALLGSVFAVFAWPSHGGWVFYTPYSTMSESAATPQFSMWIPLLILGFVLIAELVPVPLQIFSVKVFKRKLFPYTPIHHAFEKAGVPETRVVWHFLLAQIILAALAYGVYLGLSGSSDPPSRVGYYYSAP